MAATVNRIYANAGEGDVRKNFQRLSRMLDNGATIVCSVGVSMPSIFVVSGSPVDSSGTITVTLATQAANTIFGGPTVGADAAPTFRALVTDDLSDGLVTYAKIQDVSATDKLLGRQTAGAGDVEEITCTAAGRALLDDADALAQRTTLGLGTIATQDADDVTITGGSISGCNIDGTTATTFLVDSTAADKTQIQTVGLARIGTTTNLGLYLLPKGSGAIQTTTDGDARGQYATDLQRYRGASTQVASGNYAVLLGGVSNRSTSYYTTVCGGYNNQATNSYATVCGGDTVRASGTYSFAGGGDSVLASGSAAAVVCGLGSTASGDYSFIGSGQGNSALGDWSFVGGGKGADATGDYSGIVSGLNCEANADYSLAAGFGSIADGAASVALGASATARLGGMLAFASGALSLQADAQHELMVLRGETWEDSTTLTGYSGGNYTLREHSVLTCIVVISAYCPDQGDGAGWVYLVTIRRDGSNNTALVGTPTMLHEKLEGVMVDLTVDITADDTNEALAVQVDSTLVSDVVRWTATVYAASIFYPN